MTLTKTGSTAVEPSTSFYWDNQQKACLELTEIGDSHVLIRASKSYRLVKQDLEGQESWSRNLAKMNDELASTFSSFRISVDYTDTTSTRVLNVQEEASELLHEAQKMSDRIEELEKERDQLEAGLDIGVDQLKDRLQERHGQIVEEQEDLRNSLQQILGHLEEKKTELNQWKKNGVSVSYLFQFSTDPEIVPRSELEEACQRHLDEAFNLHRRKVKQVLQGPRFKLHVEELEEPRVLNRLEHTQLLNPESFEHLTEQVETPELKQELEQLQQASVQQYMAVALNDISIGESVVERAKSTPAKAVSSILQDLESERVANPKDVPNNGPIIGTVTGTNHVVGFDPAELPHYYIMGESGSGKSYLKRVLLENCVSLGYDVLTISPSDTEEIGLSLENPGNNKAGAGLSVDQYWIGNDKMLDTPESIDELFTGINAVTLSKLPEDEKQDYVDRILSRLAEIDRSAKPLFVFLEEAHNFNKGKAADAIQKLVREARKFGIHVVIVSQNPTDFSHNHRHVRENTVSVFLRGEYTDYAEKFLGNEDEITKLDTGEAIIQGPDFSKINVDVRETLTKPTAPTEDELETVDSRFTGQAPDISDEDAVAPSNTTEETEELSEDEEQLVDFIQDYIRENDERPSKSKCYREDNAPFGSSKTMRLLEQLIEKQVLEEDTVERYGNESQVYATA